jgi:cellulose synthase/poly-beta-1,6-N-acetylglucosamine synthase-like glycosyltransferase
MVVVIESDTFVDNQTITELIKPFADNRIGGVVGDQRIYKPYDSLVNFFNTLAEGIKYAITIPALSVFGKVTVLGGRCVAYRKSAVLPLLPNLVNEKFLKRRCISGDDGRLTSLLLQTNWRTLYQSTAVVYTVSPPTWYELARQRLRWTRNSCRRTSRALLWDKLWAWRKPVVTLQMLSTWTGTLAMCLMVYAVVNSIVSTSWFWFGTTLEGSLVRIGVLIGGIALTRVIRINPILRYHSTRKWIYFLLFPWYLIAMWGVRLYAIVTMNKQGWITRQDNGAGGFNNHG